MTSTKTFLTNRLLQDNNVVKAAEIHRLGDNAVFGMRFTTHRVPPKILSAEVGNAESDFMINHSRFSVEFPQRMNQTSDEMLTASPYLSAFFAARRLCSV
jgi:hypothetical protein